MTLIMENRYTNLGAGLLTWESQCSWFRRLFLWNRTSWIESDSIPRRVSWAWCKWKASHGWSTDSWRLWNDGERSCRQALAPRKWNISSTSHRQTHGVNTLNFRSRREAPPLLQGILTFLIIMTRKGSLMARVLLLSMGQVMKLVDTLVPMISRTEDWISESVSLLMWPFLTFLSQIWSGLDLIANTG